VATEGSHTFVFADLAGFTALTEAMGDEPAADVVADFCAAVRAVLPAYGAEEIKSIGDAVMIRVADANRAVALGLELVNTIGRGHGALMIRVGMHTGPAIERDRDWFGATVNLAARVSAVASGGEVLVTEETRAAAGEVADVEIREHGRQAFKNVAEPVLLHLAVAQGAADAAGLPIDPVCRMAVDPDHGAGRLVHEGVEYHFCSLDCAGKFAATPERWA